MEKQMAKINTDSFVSVSVVVLLVTVSVWASIGWSKTMDNGTRIEKVEIRQDKYDENLATLIKEIAETRGEMRGMMLKSSK